MTSHFGGKREDLAGRLTDTYLLSTNFDTLEAVSTGSSKLDRSSEFGLLKVRSTSGRRQGCWRLSIGPSSPSRSNFGIGLSILNAIGSTTMADGVSSALLVV